MNILSCVPMQMEMQSSFKGFPLGEEEGHGLLTDLEQAEMFFPFNSFCPEALVLCDNFWSIPVGLNRHVIWSYVCSTSLHLHLGEV